MLATAIINDDESIIDAEEGELIDDEGIDGQVVVLQCLYNGAVIETWHYFAPPSARDVEHYNAINQHSMTVGTRVGGGLNHQTSAEIHVCSQAEALAKLYDKLIEKTEGYKKRVPSYHKDKAVAEVFANEVETREKN